VGSVIPEQANTGHSQEFHECLVCRKTGLSACSFLKGGSGPLPARRCHGPICKFWLPQFKPAVLFYQASPNIFSIFPLIKEITRQWVPYPFDIWISGFTICHVINVTLGNIPALLGRPGATCARTSIHDNENEGHQDNCIFHLIFSVCFYLYFTCLFPERLKTARSSHSVNDWRTSALTQFRTINNDSGQQLQNRLTRAICQVYTFSAIQTYKSQD
jgi:hypothetical protein